MFYGIGHITLRTIYTGLLQTFIEQTTGRANERPAFQVFLIAGLFADKDHARSCVAVAKNQLGGVPVEVTSFATFRFRVQGAE